LVLSRLMASVSRFLKRYSKTHSRRHLYEWLHAAVEEYARSATEVLNIGSGGEIEEAIARTGVPTLSIDVDPARSPDLVMDAQDMTELADGRFDLVLLLEVLEHVPEPARALAEIRRVLRPGGCLIGSTPFLLGIHDHPNDFHRFTRFGLARLFADFEVLELAERTGYFEAVYVLCLRVFNVGGRVQIRRAVLLSPLILALRPVFWLLDRALPSSDATTGYFFVLRRPEGEARRAGEVPAQPPPEPDTPSLP